MIEKLRHSFLYPLLCKFYPELHHAFVWYAWQFCSLLPIQKQKIIFSNFNGKGFGDNPRYIAEECIRQHIPCRLLWVCESAEYRFPPEISVIRPDSLRFIYHMATAGFWIDNTRKLYYFKKRKGQTYIQTWHGGPGLKHVEKDAGSGLSPEYIAYAKRDSRYIDLLLSNCRFQTKCLKQCFWYQGPIMEKGLPKNDLYFRDVSVLRNMVRDHWQLSKDVKLVLYVPTWRENRKLNVYHLNFDSCLDALKQRFGGTWIMLVRLHPNVNAADFDIHYTDRVLNASSYDNVQELLAAGDAVITDYSSCGFDYLQLGRLCFFYAEDYEEMKHDKGYYLEPDDLPVPTAFSNDALIQNILNHSEETYQKKREAYMSSMDYYDDGSASNAVVEYILQKMASAKKQRPDS